MKRCVVVVAVVTVCVVVCSVCEGGVSPGEVDPRGNAVHLGAAMPFLRADDYLWLEQVLDHFDEQNHDTFKQRYWVDDSHWERQGGPVFLYICGEGECGGVPGGYLQDTAATFGGLILVLEHRYFGMSSPFEDLSTHNLRFLTVSQALADLAHFSFVIKQSLNISEGSRWISVGGSYPGALSAWFKIKYPHLLAGSWSSSGVVNAILDFTAFDEQITRSAGLECAAVLRNVTHLAEQQIATPSGKSSLYTTFGVDATDFADEGDFWYLLADSMSLPFQYGYPDKICGPMMQAAHSGKDLVQAFASFAKSFFYPTFCPGIGPRSYSTVLQSQTQHTPERNERQWWLMKCSSLAYFQNAPAQNSMRSVHLNMEYHRRHCTAVFGEEYKLFPDTAATNNRFGATDVATDNVIFLNGSQDPWQWAAVRDPLGPTRPARITTCENCGHCVDLRGCPGGCADGDASLETTRGLIHGFLDKVLHS